MELESLGDADLLLNLGGRCKHIEDEVDGIDFGLLSGKEKAEEENSLKENPVEEEAAEKKEMTAEEMETAVEAILEDGVESREFFNSCQ